MNKIGSQLISYSLPGLFEYYEFYNRFLPLFFKHREYFYDWCTIDSIYGSPNDCIWSGGRIESSDVSIDEVFSLMKEYNISIRLTFSNSLIIEKHLDDYRCNDVCNRLNRLGSTKNGIIISSSLLLNYLKNKYNNLYFVSSTTKVIKEFDMLVRELNNIDFKYVVPDFRINKHCDQLKLLNQELKNKIELLCNECCSFSCELRKECYENVSKIALGNETSNFKCGSINAFEGYKFSKAMTNPGFISLTDILSTYYPIGISNFKIEGRGLGSALLLEFILYYMTKPDYQINVREEMYLTNSLDLF